MSIYTNVVSLIGDAIDDVTSAVSGFDFGPEYPTIPAVDFTSTISGTVPANPAYTPAGPPTTNITGAVDKAAYNALSSVVGGISIQPLPSILDYLDPVHPKPLPDYGYPAPVGQPPETGFVDVLASAGLEAVPSPTVQVGTPREMSLISNLTYEAYGFEKLEAALPVVVPVPDVAELSNPDQLVVALDPRVLDAIQTALAGQDIKPIQEELYRLTTKDTCYERTHAERALFAESASKGFGDSNGGLFEKLADLNYAAALQDFKAYEAGRDSLYDSAQQKLRTAVQQAIALETANFAVHLAYAAKLIEVFEINLALHTTLFNVTLDIYNTQLAGVNALIDAYNTYIGVILAEQAAEASELDIAQAKLTTNKALINMFEAQSRTAQTRVGIYEADIEQATFAVEEYTIYIDGLLQNVDIMRANIKSYEDALKAYSESTKADKSKIDAFGAQVRAEGAATDVYRENWDLYSAANSALSAQNGAIRQFNSASLQALNAEIGVFRSAADQQRAYLRGVSGWLRANSAVVNDHSRSVESLVRFMTGKNSTVVSLEDARTRIELAIADFNTTEQALDAQRQAAQASIDAGLAASEAATYAGMANAAYAIRSVSADLNSSSSDSDDRSFRSTANESETYNRSYSYTKRF